MKNRIVTFMIMLLTVIAVGSGATMLNLSLQEKDSHMSFDFQKFGPEEPQKKDLLPPMPNDIPEGMQGQIDTGNGYGSSEEQSLDTTKQEYTTEALTEETCPAELDDGLLSKATVTEDADMAVAECETITEQDLYEELRQESLKISVSEDKQTYYARLEELEKMYVTRMSAARKESLTVQQTVAEALLKTWDDELNAIYQKLRAALIDEEFNILRSEERAWIRNRDEAANKAAAQESYSNSTQNLAYTRSLLEWTKSRVYELAKMYYGE